MPMVGLPVEWETRTMSPMCAGTGRWTRPAAIAFPEPLDGPVLHVPTFRKDVTVGNAFCLRCEQEITLRQFITNEVCPGRA